MTQRVEKGKRPLYHIGQIVNVVDYYDDMIVRGYYLALILGIKTVSYKSLHFKGVNVHFVYDLLPLKEGPYNKYRDIAEEHQIVSVEEE